MNNKVLILYPHKNDIQSVILYEELLKRGHEVLYLPFRCDEEDNCEKGYHIDRGNLYYSGYSLQHLKAVYIRALAFSVPANLPAYLSRSEHAIWRAKYLVENVRFSALFSMLNILKRQGVLIINHPHAYHQHNTKAQFFSYLRSSGYSVPEFVSTNDYRLCQSLCEKDEYVCKSAFGVGATRLLKKESLHPQCGMNRTPIFVQKKVSGYTVRVHTVGTKAVLSLKILSEGLDSRSETTGFTVEALPEKVSDEVGRINKEFGCHYSAWDVILHENGEFSLLDLNPGPYIGWIGSYFTRYVMASLAQYIHIYRNNAEMEDVSGELHLPQLDFSRVMVNRSGFTPDYQVYCKERLRIRY